MMFWKRTNGKQLLDEPRRHHYVFAHQAVRNFCWNNPLQFFALIGSNRQRGFLEFIWKSVEDKLGEPAKGLSPADVEVTTCRIKGFPSILMKMPVPQAAAEAHAIGIVLIGAPQEGQEVPEKPAFRYFTLECKDNLDGSAGTVLCEWTDDAHLNYGDGPIPDLTLFLNAIAAKI
jgi:hypothetical protein